LPTKEEHTEKAINNEKFGEVLCQSPTFIDWAVTVLFYSALHYCHAVLAVYGQHPTSHEATGPFVRNNPVLKKIWKEYESLRTASRNARYYMLEITPQHLADVRADFNTIRSYVRKQIGLKD
jgi:hypothetical protein